MSPMKAICNLNRAGWTYRSLQVMFDVEFLGQRLQVGGRELEDVVDGEQVVRVEFPGDVHPNGTLQVCKRTSSANYKVKEDQA